jgi:hypothetical protein
MMLLLLLQLLPVQPQALLQLTEGCISAAPCLHPEQRTGLTLCLAHSWLSNVRDCDTSSSDGHCGVTTGTLHPKNISRELIACLQQAAQHCSCSEQAPYLMHAIQHGLL